MSEVRPTVLVANSFNGFLIWVGIIELLLSESGACHPYLSPFRLYGRRQERTH